jgi:hypothetical protein
MGRPKWIEENRQSISTNWKRPYETRQNRTLDLNLANEMKNPRFAAAFQKG